MNAKRQLVIEVEYDASYTDQILEGTTKSDEAYLCRAVNDALSSAEKVTDSPGILNAEILGFITRPTF